MYIGITITPLQKLKCLVQLFKLTENSNLMLMEVRCECYGVALTCLTREFRHQTHKCQPICKRSRTYTLNLINSSHSACSVKFFLVMGLCHDFD